MKRILTLSATLLITLFLAACASTSSENERPKGPPIIAKGMAIEEIVAMLGKPFTVKDADPPSPDTEIWVFKKVFSNSKLVVTGTRETPMFNAQSQGIEMVEETVVTPEVSQMIMTTEMLISHGKLVAWKKKEVSSVELQR